MMGTDTEVVRRDADRWSLAGDRQLLAILKTMHEKVITRATHVDTKVEEMMSTVRCAGVALENVNNKLASLSSNQFIESRVYDDDSELTTKTEMENQQSKIQKCESSPTEGLLVLQRFYEELEILPDSSDSDDEEHPSNVVLRAKDLYADRPLPAIIGSAAWKNKWHAGLLEEDSDSDSSVCKRDSNVDQYSSSDEGGVLQESLPINREHHESFTSEEIPVSDEESTGKGAGAGQGSKVGLSDGHYATQSQQEITHIPQSQSEFAAELARRLGGHVAQSESTATVAPSTVDVRKGHTARHMFSDQVDRHRVTGNLFSDEPPPLDAVSDDDMFDTQRPAHKHLDNIFYDDDDDDDNDIFDDFADSNVGNARKPKEIDPPASTVKKPVGGKSLFGSQKGAENIGAAIRKRRESISSDDEAQHPQDNTTRKTLGDDRIKVNEKTDIFDDLFAKSEQENKKLELKDDIFDDIDDIFSTEIVSKAPIKEVTVTKNIFDDHDDLFADIDVNFDFKTHQPSQTKQTQKVVEASQKDTPNTNTTKYSSKATKAEDLKNIFGDDDDDDYDNNGLFSNIAKTEISKDKFKTKSLFDGSDEDLFKEDKDYTINSANVTKNIVENQGKMQQEFDIQSNTTSNKISENIAETKSNIFEDSKSDDLFIDHKSHQNEESKQEIVDSNVNLREKVNTETTSSTFLSVEDHNIEKEHIDDVAIPKHSNVSNEYQSNEAIDRDEINSSSQDGLLSNKEYIDEKLVNSLHKSNLNEKHDEFSDAEKNIDELFRNSVKNDETTSSVANDFHDIFNDHPPPVEKTDNIKKSSNINALFDDDDDNLEISSTTNNDFHDIFNDQPPVFEKSKDIKKSKNINALFDDDSDDESLFFKKSDTLEEKPDVFLPKNDSDRVFGLFNDEPPAVISDEDDIFGNKHVIQKSVSDFATDKEQPGMSSISVSDKIQNIDDLPKENVAANIKKINQKSDGKDVFTETDARKSVGKIKSSININVSTLLPGASPKKIASSPEHKKDNNETIDRSNEKSELDGTIFNKPLETSTKIKEYPVAIVKSASFDGNPESPVLCNKFSKERARIQVRRRPSTRKARREAIKRSDTDSDLAKISDDTDGPTHTSISTLGKVYTDHKELVQSDSDDTEVSSPINDVKKSYKDEPKDLPQSINESVLQIKPETAITLPNNPDKRQLVIEDSDDEDIFKTFTQKAVPIEIKKPKETSKVEQTLTIETRKVDTVKQKSLFGDDSSDEELFGGNNSKSKKSDNAKSSDRLLTKPPVTQHKSLFGDDSDEDIFATNTKVKAHSQPTKRDEKTVIVPSTLPVTEDPLSMFDSPE